MAHKTLISGTAYSVTGGRELIGGTGYDCKAGKTLIGGTAFTVPFLTVPPVPLGTVETGAILMIKENGALAKFCITKHDYESGLNGAGRTLIVKKGVWGEATAFGTKETGTSYASSVINEKLGIYANTVVDERIRGEIKSIKIPITNGNGNVETTTMNARCFILSMTELGFKDNPTLFNTEGSVLPNANALRVKGQWTRTPCIKDGLTDRVFYLMAETQGSIRMYWDTVCTIIPAFTLPSTLAVVANADGTYSLAS